MLGKLSQDEIISHLHLIYEEAPLIVTYKSPTLEILYANKAMREYVGCPNLNGVEGKTDYDFKWARFANLYVAHEKETINKNIYTALFPICDNEFKEGLATCNRMPLYNAENQLIGILSHSHLIQNSAALELGNLFLDSKEADKNFSIDKNKNLFNLTDREKACLFFIIRGKSSKGIAKILGIAHRTVECYINTLKLKFNCACKSELIELAIHLGYHYDLPSCLLSLIKKDIN